MYNSINDIKQALKANNDVLTLKLGVLVKTSPSKLIRATPGNVRTVCSELEHEEIGFFCNETNPDQNTLVRVYKLNSAVAEIIEAVLYPSRANDDVIRYASLLEKVREMLCS